jgi:hypothetical protein
VTADLQALKMFTSGSGGGSGGSTQLVSLAMGEASKLFDASGGASSGGKQEVVNGAAMTMMKLVVQVRCVANYTIYATLIYVNSCVYSPSLAESLEEVTAVD